MKCAVNINSPIRTGGQTILVLSNFDSSPVRRAIHFQTSAILFGSALPMTTPG